MQTDQETANKKVHVTEGRLGKFEERLIDKRMGICERGSIDSGREGAIQIIGKLSSSRNFIVIKQLIHHCHKVA